MAEIPLIIQRLREPISDNTRKIRRELLVASTIGIVIVHAGLVPTRIDALGITLTESNQASFRYVVAGVVLYLTVAFLVYVSSEIVAWASLLRSFDLEQSQKLLEEQLRASQVAVEEAHERLKVAKKNFEQGTDTGPRVTKESEAAFREKRARLLEELEEARRFVAEHKVEIDEVRDKVEKEQRQLSMNRFARELWSPDSGSRLLVEPVRLLKPMVAVRITFEAVVPLALATFAVVTLLT